MFKPFCNPNQTSDFFTIVFSNMHVFMIHKDVLFKADKIIWLTQKSW